jgi:hypothetical protein
MNRIVSARARSLAVGFIVIQVTGVIGLVRADDPTPCVDRKVVVTRSRPRYVQSASATLGVFRPTPYIMVGGAYPTASGGYSPLGIYGDSTLPLYGPMSAFRVSTAPVLAYSRGYDGQVHVVEANSFSYPNLPSLSPVVYPTESNYYWGPRVNRTPRWGSSAINWIDQN